MISRRALRALVVCASVPVSLALASPAYAVVRDDGDEPGEGLSYLATLLAFVVLPAALFAIIALLVVLPSLAKGPRYRSDVEWGASPVWFGPAARPGHADEAASATAPTAGKGGTRARW